MKSSLCRVLNFRPQIFDLIFLPKDQSIIKQFYKQYQIISFKISKIAVHTSPKLTDLQQS